MILQCSNGRGRVELFLKVVGYSRQMALCVKTQPDYFHLRLCISDNVRAILALTISVYITKRLLHSPTLLGKIFQCVGATYVGTGGRGRPE